MGSSSFEELPREKGTDSKTCDPPYRKEFLLVVVVVADANHGRGSPKWFKGAPHLKSSTLQPTTDFEDNQTYAIYMSDIHTILWATNLTESYHSYRNNKNGIQLHAFGELLRSRNPRQ